MSKAKTVELGQDLPPGARWRGKSIQVNVYRGYDAATGRRMYASETAKTPAEAWRIWRRLKQEVEEGEYVPPARQTVAAYLDEWLAKSAEPNVKPKTYARYKSLVDVHIKRHIGDVKLSKLTPRHVEGLLAAMKGEVSDRTRLQAYRVLHRALNVAVRWKLVGRNVCSAVEPPKTDEPEMYVLSAEEVDRLLKAARGELDLRPPESISKFTTKRAQQQDERARVRLYPLILTAVYTGMRQGELLGLRWEDVNIDEGVAWVRQTLEKAGKKPVFGTPKNRKFRAVPLAPVVVDALRNLRVEQEIERAHYAQDYRDYGLVFCQQDGAPIDARSLTRWHWRKILAQAGLPDSIRFHDLRHTFVSRSLAAGASLREVSDIVGHHDPGFTARRYAHTLHDDRKRAVQALADYLAQTASCEKD